MKLSLYSINTRIYVFIIILLCAYLTFKGLDNNYFWDDESNTAIFAKNLLKTGKLTAWDGRNLIAFRNGSELNSNLVNSFMPPLQYYITALSFYFFGISTWTGRFPFALIGLFSLFILFKILEELKMDKHIILIAVTVCAFSPSFLLYIRQCRYYSLTIFLALCVYYFYIRFLQTNKKITLFLLVLNMILLFYAHYTSSIAFLLSIFIAHIIYNARKRDIKYLAIIFITFAIFTIPYILYRKPFLNIDILIPKDSASWIAKKIILLFWHSRELNSLNWFPWIAAVGLICFLFLPGRNNKLRKLGKEWITIVFFFILFTALLSPQPVTTTSIADIRYTVILLPFLSGLTAMFLFFVETKSRFLFAILFPIIIFTNLLSIDPLNRKCEYPLIRYINEIHNDYTTPYEAVDRFLIDFANQDDLVFITPEYMNYPIMFYRGDKVRLCGLLNKNTRLPIALMNRLNPDLFIEETVPDWVIIFGRHNTPRNMLNHLLRKGIRYELYNILNVYWLDMTRPELLFHSFGPIKNFYPSDDGILVYKKMKNKVY